MTFMEFLTTVTFAIAITLILLGWAALHDRLCIYTDTTPRVQRCVVLETR
jgi:hypothetical protein